MLLLWLPLIGGEHLPSAANACNHAQLTKMIMHAVHDVQQHCVMTAI
jgi:hypothetical protein